jgi:glycosyltransferase involved in cell wall biosynthesis
MHVAEKIRYARIGSSESSRFKAKVMPFSVVHGWRVEVAVVLPCFNEVDTIEECVRGLLALDLVDCIAVVDDGSSDGTAQRCAEMADTLGGRLVVLQLPMNVGKNAAVRYAAELIHAQTLVVFDADLTVAPAELGTVLTLVKQTPHLFAYGSRFRCQMSKGTMRACHRLGNRVFAAWVSMLARHPISDAFCGLKVLPREVLVSRRASRCRWGDLDLIFAALDAGLEFREIPVTYRQRRAGVSKMNALRAGWVFALQCLAYGLRKNPCLKGKLAEYYSDERGYPRN